MHRGESYLVGKRESEFCRRVEILFFQESIDLL